MRHSLFLLLVLGCLLTSCSGSGKEGNGTEEIPLTPMEGTLPAEMPDDFYVAVREKGGSEPYDNIFYVSSDSISRESWYYNYQTINALPGNPEVVKQLYREIVDMHPEKIGSRTDSLKRITDRGGEISEIRANGQLMQMSNVGNSYIEGASGELFNQLNNRVKSFVVGELSPLMKRVDLELDYGELGYELVDLEVRINDFPLVGWNPSKGKIPPATGYNSVLPGKYHLYGRAQYNQGFGYLTDSLLIGEENLRLKIRVLNDKLVLEK